MTKSGLHRFAAVNEDPRFRRPKKELSKVRIDDRFKGMFKDKDFINPVSVDKYGRRVREDHEKETLKRFYRLEEGEEEEEEEKEQDTSDAADEVMSESEDSVQADKDDQVLMDDLAPQHPLADEKVELGEATKRLALVNMDWDQIRAVDILSFTLAFKPPIGTINSVKIYPSEFGKARLAVEASSGPCLQPVPRRDDVEEKGQHEKYDDDCDEPFSQQNEVDEAQLRKYQLDRLRYYYAVIECDSVATACSIYNSCDGIEFEQSGNIVDLRFIPNDTCFEDSESIQIATSVGSRYKGNPEVSTAVLQSSSVKLTWDQDDPERARITQTAASMSRLNKTQRKKIDLRDVDMAAYLASGSSDDEGESNVEEYRQKLLQSTNSNVFGRKSQEEGKDLEITFASAFASTTTNNNSNNNQGFDAEATFEMSNGKEEEQSDDNLTVFQREQLKKKQKKAEKRAKRKTELLETKSGAASINELTALLKGSDAAKHFDLLEEKEDLKRHKGRKGKTTTAAQKATSASSIDTKDPRFAAIYDRPEYAIDPSAASFKRTPGMQALLEERSKRRSDE